MSHRPASLHLSLSHLYPAVPFSRNSSLCLHPFLLLSVSRCFIPCLALDPLVISILLSSHQLLLTGEAFSSSALCLLQQPTEFHPRSLASTVPTSFHFLSDVTYFCQSSGSLSCTLKDGRFSITSHSLSPSVHSSVLSPLSSLPFIYCQPVDVFRCGYNTETEA